MKTYAIYILSFFLLFLAQSTFAQSTKKSIKVAGECGMCKGKIEAAAKKAGARKAEWDVESKVLTVSYAAKATDMEKIQQSIAAAGYDTPAAKATDAAYEALHGCCKYDREASAKAMACCAEDTCMKDGGCCKDGKCSKDMACCKDSGCDKKDCCKKED